MPNTVQDLLDAVKRFVYKNTGAVESFQGETSAADMETFIDASCLTAMNNARLYAEKNASFDALETTVLVTLAPNGSIDLNALVDEDENAVRMNGLLRANYVATGGGKTPIGLDTKQSWHRAQQTQQDTSNYYYTATGGNGIRSALVLLKSGTKLFPSFALTESITVELTGYRWMDKYTADALDATDFLLEDGFDFLMWQSILEMNYITQIYVPRVEGSLSPPERSRNEAWAGLMTNDAFATASLYNDGN